jgi:5'-nucleotidase
MLALGGLMVRCTRERRGAFVLTHSGRRVYFLDPRASDFCVADVARGLAAHPRWAGQTVEPYSVAQHSVLVAEAAEEERAETIQVLRALFHDGAEAFAADLVRPLKNELRHYRRIEERMFSAMCAAFGLPIDAAPVVQRAHGRVEATERRDLFPPGERRLRVAGAARDERIRIWGWREAEERFLAAYDRLEAKVGGRRADVGRAWTELHRAGEDDERMLMGTA